MRFEHGLPESIIKRLAAEAKKSGWWADVLADKDLIIATRGDSLNVYFRGQSIFRVAESSAGLTVTTHEKYLLDPTLRSQVPLAADGSFQIEQLIDRGFIRRYEGSETLRKLKKASERFSGLEKAGCHEIAVRNGSVVDCEIAFPGFVDANDDSETDSGRIDFACFQEFDDDVRLVFWEAKHYSNKELRADLRTDALAPVCDQIQRYKKFVASHRKQITESFTRVATNLVCFSEMGWQRKLPEFVVAVANGSRRLVLGDDPQVGLLIFGFDEAQRESDRWKKHMSRLKCNINPVHAVGVAKEIDLRSSVLRK